MELIKNQGFKQTEVGLIPEDWDFKFHDDVASTIDSLHQTPKFSDSGFPMVRVTDIKLGYLDLKNTKRVSQKVFEEFTRNYLPQQGDVVMSRVGSYGIVSYVNSNEKFCLGQNTVVINPKINSKYLYYILSSQMVISQIELESYGTGYKSLSLKNIKELKIPLPPTQDEQKAIATALSDIDELISNLDKLIAKKKAIKQGAMQQLLTPPHKGGKRLKGFTGEWIYLTIEQVADCLDNLRVPLNGEQRNKMQGNIPYCGANGVVDFVNDFVIDDDIILIAEDGGYFDEYKTRPIAYRMTGKCWVNNHAHILKSKKGYSQGFLYFSLVHKNILDYINGGTRAKLNKGEMSKIECWFPNKYEEQKAISEILSDMDFEIEQLESKKTKYQSLKQGMMQELLTGKTRLI